MRDEAPTETPPRQETVVELYRPRPLQARLHRSLKRFNVLVAHRRFGKTVFCVNELIARAAANRLERPRYAYVAPLFTQAKDVAWEYVKRYTAPIPGVAVVAAAAFPVLEYLDGVREGRTGVTRYTQGLDADSLNKTATGISQIMAAAQQRIELIARVFAETGVKDLFRQILRLVGRHQNAPRIIRLRNRWVPMDPRSWSTEMDVSVNVGLGTGNRDQMLGHLHTILGIQAQAIQQQGGVDGPLVRLDNVYNTLAKIVENAGLKPAEAYFSRPSDQPAPPMQPEPPPDPQLLLLEQQAKIDAARIALAERKAAAEIALDRAKLDAEMELKREELAARLALKQEEMLMRAGREAAAGEGAP